MHLFSAEQICSLVISLVVSSVFVGSESRGDLLHFLHRNLKQFEFKVYVTLKGAQDFQLPSMPENLVSVQASSLTIGAGSNNSSLTNSSSALEEHHVFGRAQEDIRSFQVLYFAPLTMNQTEVYLERVIKEAYNIRRLDFRMNKIVIFWIRSNNTTLEELLTQLKALSSHHSVLKSQYLYPTLLDKFYVTFDTTEDGGTIYEIFSLGRRDHGRFEASPVLKEDIGCFTTRRGTLNGAPLAAAIVDTVETELVTEFDPKTNRTVLKAGLSHSVIRDVETMTNFTLNVRNYFKGWVEILPNSTFKNVGRVLNEELEDIFILQTTYTGIRARSFKLLVPHHIQGVYAFFLQPTYVARFKIFWVLFTPRVWAALAGFILFFAANKYLLETAADRQEQRRRSRGTLENPLSDVFMWTAALLAQQGWTQVPRTASLKILFVTASLMVLVCQVAFSANLVSTLSVTPIPIKTFFDLLKSNFRLAAYTDSSVIRHTVQGDQKEFTFDKENAETLRRKTDKFLSYYGGAELILSSPSYAFLGYDTLKGTLINTYNQTGDDFCRKIAALPVHNLPFRSGMIATKNFPYREIFNKNLIHLIQTGLLHRYNRHFDMESSAIDCQIVKEMKREGKSLELRDVIVAFGIAASGMILSFFILVLEIFAWSGRIRVEAESSGRLRNQVTREDARAV